MKIHKLNLLTDLRFWLAPLILCVIFILIYLSVSHQSSFRPVIHNPLSTSFWVWNRPNPLSQSERTALSASGVHQLYWYVGILTLREGHWVWVDRKAIDWDVVKSDPGLEIVPTVRLEPPASQIFTDESNTELIHELSSLESASHARMLQLDYESTDRHIGSYLEFLKQLKAQNPPYRISVTALGHWHRFANDFEGLADEIVPMFYDLNPGREKLENGRLPDLADANAADSLQLWSSCRVPWKAGLPNFSRISVVAENGTSRGNIRKWRWADVWFSPDLAPLAPTQEGQTAFRVANQTVLADTPLLKDETLIVRYADMNSLKRLVLLAENDGATGVTYFRLVDDYDMSGYDSSDVAQTAPANAPSAAQIGSLSLAWSGTRLLLSNGTPHNLMPKVANDLSPGYALVVEAPGSNWREAVSGDFAKVTLDSKGEHGVSELGLGVSRLYFWFATLRPDQSISTGFIQRDASGPVRWQILNLESKETWHTLN